MKLLLPLLLLLAQGSLRAAETPDAPGHYMGRRIAQTMHWSGAAWLIRHEREREESCSKLLENLALKPGQTVCDLGCGNGFYTLPMARAVVPGGKVLAVDIQPEMLRLLNERAEKEKVSGIETILGTEDDPKIPEASCDLILLVDTYHEVSGPAALLAHTRKALKPDGLLVLAEFRAEDDSVPIRPEHKMSIAEVKAELEPEGFKLSTVLNDLPWQHILVLTRSDAP